MKIKRPSLTTAVLICLFFAIAWVGTLVNPQPPSNTPAASVETSSSSQAAVNLATVPVITAADIPALTTEPATNLILGTRSKTSNCQVNSALPDKSCTPGAVFANVTRDQVCTSGYSSSVRDVSDVTKAAVYAEYGISTHITGQYEVDHFISLELGGSNDIGNLWPEAASPSPGFAEKDVVENFLHTQLCNGSISLSAAQQDIAGDWTVVYRQISN